MTGWIDRLRWLRAEELALVPRVLALTLRVLALQNRVSVPRLVALFTPTAREAPRTTPYRLVRIVKAVQFRLFRGDFCMKQSLVLYALLTRWGRAPRIVFGIRKDGDDLAGHAWVELDGEPLGEATDPRAAYRVTYARPEPAPSPATSLPPSA